jgi:hypothetical protein
MCLDESNDHGIFFIRGSSGVQQSHAGLSRFGLDESLVTSSGGSGRVHERTRVYSGFT